MLLDVTEIMNPITDSRRKILSYKKRQIYIVYRQTPIFDTLFSENSVFSLKYVLGTPPQKFWRYVLIRNTCDNEVQFTILTGARALKKLLSSGVEVTSTLPNSET